MTAPWTDRSDLGHVTLAIEPEPAWTADAACRDRTDVSWFPAAGEPAGPAKAVCATCSVRVDCESEARRLHQRHGHIHGVWAGTTRQDRRRWSSC